MTRYVDRSIGVLKALSLFFVCTLIVVVPCPSRSVAESPVVAATANVKDHSQLRNVGLRSRLESSRKVFTETKAGHVAFIGGSITEMNGYRPMVCRDLQKRFPDTKFTFTDAGISSTCSTTGACRLDRDVLSKGPVDLFFVEFAVNDDQDAGHSFEDALRGMEGIVRHTLMHNPKADLVITHFVNPGMLKLIQSGKEPISISAHEKVAQHYGINTIRLSHEVKDRIADGTLDWKTFGGTHPAPAGNAIPAEMIDAMLAAVSTGDVQLTSDGSQFRPVRKTVEDIPDPIDQFSYSRARLIEHGAVKKGDGWIQHVPNWKEIKGGFRGRFANDELICSDKLEAECSYSFDGTGTGAYVLAGPDAGALEVTIDDSPPVRVELFHRFSSGLHYPRTVMFANDLKPGTHQVKLKLVPREGQQTAAARVLSFVAN